MWLVIKNVIFTLVVPATFSVYLPLRLLGPSAAFSIDGVRALGLLPICVGATFYFWCLWHFANSGRGTPAPIDPPKTLVTKGLYRKVRNPIYVGVLLILFGEAIVFASRVLAIYAIGVLIAFHLFVVFYEEPTLRAKFDGSYEDYCRNVPRWVPKK
jgi:protein-S-isoprenylcysteine O-methyltransferase Ste14